MPKKSRASRYQMQVEKRKDGKKLRGTEKGYLSYGSQAFTPTLLLILRCLSYSLLEKDSGTTWGISSEITAVIDNQATAFFVSATEMR